MNIKLISSDIDGTLLGDLDKVRKFKKIWMAQPKTKRPYLCYNTGRLLDDVLRLIKEKTLPEPDFIISGIGTSIYHFPEGRILKEFSEILEEGWNSEIVTKVLSSLGLDIEKQPEYLQDDFKSSWFLDEATHEQISEIEKQLEANSLEVHVVYSNAHYLDILPKWANKGNALRWLLRDLSIANQNTVVAGDSGNDNAMFLLKNICGIVVANAQPELYFVTKHLPTYHAEYTFAEGVLEGLVYYGVLDKTDLEEISEGTAQIKTPEIDYDQVPHIEEGWLKEISDEQQQFLEIAYQKAVVSIKKNITPMGFSAASLVDNISEGTDENYRSVWARDGAIAIIGTIPLIGDRDIHECQRNTFKTLFEHISPNGQIPANVRIDDKRPDYSGVGGISSIDSALWLIIAFYEYIRVTRDFALLRKYFETLQRMMNWLSAHDSNNDALLEIPEAGDWTDLLGHRYNIIYDEVLWYRTNICFGRMLGWLGDDSKAGHYLRWSQIIKKEILINFWPSTKQRIYQTITFDEQQYSLGDAQYLIAQITPFSFSWRCDIYGNVLAFLYNVIDQEKAKKAFQFMWGSGINQPYPVTNLYPPIMAGDQDWRQYYTVNLLNLPHHYHNGGVWPFIGAQWVRFINKLGLRELALQELCRVAELNRQGIFNEWEFNEWAHGVTGRPMGKAYQAWSASEFILACHDLKLFN